MTLTQGASLAPPSARLTGSLYLLYFLAAVSDEAFVGRHRLLLYDIVDLAAHAFYIAVTLLFYYLFRPVNRRVSLIAALLSLLGCANDVLGLFQFAAHRISSLAFFGPYCLLLGYLMFRSTFLPRTLGVLMALAGAGWLLFLFPIAGLLSTYLKVLGFVAEASLMLWLIVKGIDVPKWQAMASRQWE